MQGFLRIFLAATVMLLASASPTFAAGAGHQMPLNAEYIGGIWTNSWLMVWISTGLIVLFCRVAAGKISIVPAGMQNFAEWLIEGLYNFFGSLLGPELVKKTFWFFGGTFLFILLTNWLALIPGVGTLGWEVTMRDDAGNEAVKWLPIMRGGNADLNMTSAMAVTFMVVWFYWALQANGIKGFVAHIFAPKGKFQGVMMKMMVVIFFLVGLLEVISILIRPIALSFRLFGNIYGGEQALEKLMGLVPPNMAFLPAFPFYFMEILVGLIQALVFSLLAAIFLNLICDHGDEEHH